MIIDDGFRIALLEDDPYIGSVVHGWLNNAGYTVDWYVSGAECVEGVSTKRYSACLLDWVVPDMAGPEVMVRIQLRRKEAHFPVIFITGRDSEEDMVQMLDAGADDYLVKPVTEKVLLARLNSVLRRSGVEPTPQRTRWGNIEADFQGGAIFSDGIRLELTGREATLAFYFLRNIGRLLTRPHLLSTVWHSETEADSRKIDVYVSILRRKLGFTPENGWRLVSVYGHGYRLEWAGLRVPVEEHVPVL